MTFHPLVRFSLAAIALSLAVSGCKRSAREPVLPAAAVGEQTPAPPKVRPFYGTQFTKKPPTAALVRLGHDLFHDPILSATGTLACASCHDPAHAYGPPDDRTVQAAGTVAGAHVIRAIPSLRYLIMVPPFALHHYDDDTGGDDQGPTGGFTWDGRAATPHEQAHLPLFSPLEMGNVSAVELLARVREADAGKKLRAAFGDDVFDEVAPDGGRALVALLLALEAFEQDPVEFYPFTSKYDAVIRHQTTLDAKEARGLAAFEDEKKGNCASCHPSRMNQGFPVFTDYGHIALGVPRRKDAEPGRHDLGVCGPLRTDLAGHRELCGRFRAPPLRNVARRKVFMHNGVFTRLEDAVRFYSERETQPEKWYAKKADGSVDSYDDLPPEVRGNLDRDAPFDRKPGDKPALTDDDIDDIVAFLGTLTDGYKP